MTDITELAQRARINAECGEHLSPAETLELIEALESEKRICATWRKTAKSTGEKLEKAQRYIEELREWNAGLAQESFECQQRIAELESRTVTVKLPEPPGPMSVGARTVYFGIVADVVSAFQYGITAAGIKVEVE